MLQIPGLDKTFAAQLEGKPLVYLPTMTCNATALDEDSQTQLTCHNGTTAKTTSGGCLGEATPRGGLRGWVGGWA